MAHRIRYSYDLWISVENKKLKIVILTFIILQKITCKYNNNDYSNIGGFFYICSRQQTNYSVDM